MIPPDFSYIQKILLPLFYTIQMSVTGTVLGTFFALVLSPFGAANLEFPAVMRRILRIVIQILRSFPALILALTATFLFGLGTFAGTFAITLYTFAIMTKLTYEDASAAGKKAYQALRAMGTSKYTAYIHGILPEIIPGFLTNALYLLETNVRHSSILGYVGAGGIGLLLNEKVSWREYGKVGMILVDYLTLMTADKAERNDLAYGLITKGLKTLAKELDCVVVLLTQLNRELEKRTNKRPLPSDSRDTGQIEQDCDYWLAIYREGAYDENANQSDTELLLRLNRHGETGVVYCEQRHGAIYDCDQEAASQRRREKEEKPTKRGGF